MIDKLKNKIILGDCLDIMRQMPDKCIDLVLTDPPYSQEAHGRGFASKRKIYKEMAKYTNTKNDWYNESILSEYVRLCRFPNVFLFCSKSDILNILDFCKKKGYFFFILPICKKNPVPFSNNTWLSNEFAVHFTDRKIVYSKEYKDKIPYFITGNEKETAHPNEKNLSDISRIVRNLSATGNVVFDPFSGSGTTAIAALNTGRQFICFEKDPDYHAASVKRLEEHKRQMNLF